MISFIFRRLLVLIPMAFVICFLVYLGLELTPGDAVSYMISPEAAGTMDPAQLQALRDSLGLGQPFLVRFWSWFTNLLQGNFGYSSAGGVPIAQILANRVPATLELALTALVLSSVLGSLLGVLSALKRGSGVDNGLTLVGMLGVSIPEFFFGLVAILIFALNLGWFPVGGRSQPGMVTFWDRLPHLVLPASVLAIMLTAGVMRYARASMLDALGRDFIKTARAKGLPEWRINLLHGFRVALTPVIVLIGFRLPVLIGGSVIIEQVFQWPGVGQEFIKAVRGQDYPVVMMIALLSVSMVLLASLLVDVFTALIDPRVRLED